MKLIRLLIAAHMLHALLSNPERYKYITKLVVEQGMSNYDATAKNVNKAYLMADQLIKEYKK